MRSLLDACSTPEGMYCIRNCYLNCWQYRIFYAFWFLNVKVQSEFITANIGAANGSTAANSDIFTAHVVNKVEVLCNA